MGSQGVEKGPVVRALSKKRVIWPCFGVNWVYQAHNSVYWGCGGGYTHQIDHEEHEFQVTRFKFEFPENLLPAQAAMACPGMSCCLLGGPKQQGLPGTSRALGPRPPRVQCTLWGIFARGVWWGDVANQLVGHRRHVGRVSAKTAPLPAVAPGQACTWVGVGGMASHLGPNNTPHETQLVHPPCELVEPTLGEQRGAP